MAMCFQLPEDGSAPEWLELIPAGILEGRDGRGWVNDKPEDVVAAFNSNKAPVPVDWEHAVETTPPGTPVPKAAWIEELKIQDGSIHGHFVWTERGMNSIQSRDYRFISPVFMFRRDNHRVVKITSAALTDDPNLHLKAINSYKEQQPMKLAQAIVMALGLKDDATEEQAVTAIDQLNTNLETAKNSADKNPSYEKYVPRQELNDALERAKNSQDELQSLKDAQHETEVEGVLDSFSKQYPPAKREHYKAMCSQEGGIDLFKNIMDGAPEIAGDTNLNNKDVPKTGKALNSEQQNMANVFGNSAEDLEKHAG